MKKIKIMILFVILSIVNTVTAQTVNFSNIEVVAIKDNSVTIIWDTDIAATGQVEYGTTATYGNLSEEKGLSYWQQIEVTGLTEGTEYHYRIKAVDYDGNDIISEDLTFTTKTKVELNALITAERTAQGAPTDLPQTYYVKTDGDDGDDGLSPDNAWQSPATAVSRAYAGDSICIVNDPDVSTDGVWYGEEIIFSRSGMAEAPITLAGYGDTPILDGLNRTVWRCIRSTNNSYININKLSIKDYNDAAIVFLYGSNFNISNITANNCYFAVYVSGLNYAVIDNCNFSNIVWNTVQISAETAYLSYVTLSNSDLSNSLEHGFVDLCVINGMKKINIIGNSLTYSGSDVMGSRDHGDSFPTIEDMVIMDNTFINNPANKTGMGINNLRCSNAIVNNNSFEDFGDSTYAVKITGYDIIFTNNVFTNNGTDVRLSSYVEYWSGVGFILENNYYSSIYCQQGNTTITNPLKTEFIVLPYDTARIEINYTNGTVFTSTRITNEGTYNISDIIYHPSNSNIIIESTDYAGCKFSIITYPITLQPTIENEYLTISLVNDTSAVNDTSVTVESSITTNPTTIGYTNIDYANHYVVLVVDGVDYNTAPANGDGEVSHYYEGTWETSHTFAWRQGEPTGIDKNTNLPTFYVLSANYPNPFNPQTTISYQLPVKAYTTLKIYNSLGQEIRTLINENKSAGNHSVVWDGRDNTGQQVSTGIYFYHINIGEDFNETKKMLIIK